MWTDKYENIEMLPSNESLYFNLHYIGEASGFRECDSDLAKYDQWRR